MRRHATAGLLALGLAGGAAATAQAPPPPSLTLPPPRRPAEVSSARAPDARAAAVVRSLVSAEMRRLGVPGLSLAAGAGGGIVYETALGWADVENEVKATPDTVYRLASVSKPMTAVAVLRLAAEGRLDLDAAVWRYCASYPAKRWVVTPRLLLSHQGGVRGYRHGETPQTRHFSSVAEGLALFADDPLAYEPGTAVTYSTYGYCLLGCVVEGAAGRPFAQALRELVLDPAGMQRTQPEDLRGLLTHRARGYVRGRAGDLRNSPLADMSYKVPGGGLVGTAPDVARFGLALAGGRLGAVLDAMLAPQLTRDGRDTGYGMGLALGRRRARAEAWHLGRQEQVSTVLYLRPDSGLVVAMLANLEGVQGPLLDVARRVADIVEAGGER